MVLAGRVSDALTLLTVQATDFRGGILPVARGLRAGGVHVQNPPCLPLPTLTQSSPESQEMRWMK